MRMCAIAVILGITAGCGGLVPVKRYASISDVHTTAPRSLAESGRGTPIEFPPGIRCIVAIDAFESAVSELPSRRYEMAITIVDETADSTRPMPEPVFDTAELVDDAGQRFRCRRAMRPADDPRPTDPGEPAVADFTLVFDLPPNYRFRSVTDLTVHWQLRTPDDERLSISSRFRS
ncbi:MAG: hypothetical protein KDB80_10900 [Planctomycetes bacterium]|nr:hypothetical protein [Planctomycetota bacterium]